MSLTYFKISGVEAKGVDATSNFTTDAFYFENSHDWSVSLKDIGLTSSSGTYTIEVSNNKSKWYEFNSNSTNVVIGDSVDSDHMSFQFMRVVYTANGETTGTLDVELGLNNDTRNRR